MRKEQTHPASLTSKGLLADGLIELMRTKPFRDITVTELCGRAQVARRTFYRNFDTIEDVLACRTEAIAKDFMREILSRAKEPRESILKAYFSFWNGHRELLKLLTRNNLIHILFTDYIRSVFSLPMLIPVEAEESLRPEEYARRLAYVSGGLWSVLTYWISSGCRETPEELVKGLPD